MFIECIEVGGFSAIATGGLLTTTGVITGADTCVTTGAVIVGGLTLPRTSRAGLLISLGAGNAPKLTLDASVG